MELLDEAHHELETAMRLQEQYHQERRSLQEVRQERSDQTPPQEGGKTQDSLGVGCTASAIVEATTVVTEQVSERLLPAQHGSGLRISPQPVGPWDPPCSPKRALMPQASLSVPLDTERPWPPGDPG